MFVDQLLLLDAFSQLYYLAHAEKQQRRTPIKIVKIVKIDNIHLTQQVS